MDLMQRNPKEAKKKFESDPEVTLFMCEFGKLMSGHFFKLAEMNGQTDSIDTSANPGLNKVQEVGPLQTAAIKKSK